jgi:hypothetical protein
MIFFKSPTTLGDLIRNCTEISQPMEIFLAKRIK